MIAVVFIENAPKSLIGLVSQYFTQVDRSLFAARASKRCVDFIKSAISENIGEGRAILITSDHSPMGISITEIKHNSLTPCCSNLTDITL